MSFWEDWSDIVVPIVIIIVAILCICGGVSFATSVGCGSLSDETGRETKYRLVTNTCYIRDNDGNWIPEDNWRGNA